MDKLIKRLFVILTTMTMVFSSIPFAFADDNGTELIDSNELVVEEITDETEADIDADTGSDIDVTDPEDESSDITDEEFEPEDTDVTDVDQDNEGEEKNSDSVIVEPNDTGSEEEELKKEANTAHEHSEGVWTIEPASFDKDGRRKNICPDCGEVMEDDPIYMVSDITFDNEVAAYVYDGKEIIPTVTVKDSQGNILTEDVDYTIEFADNDKVGEAKATITLQGENYSGKKEFAFIILNGKLKRTNLMVGDSKAVAIDLSITKLLGNDIKYTVEDESIATVNKDGTVTGIDAGKTVLIAEIRGFSFRSDVNVIRTQTRTLIDSEKESDDYLYEYTFTYDGKLSYEVVINGAWEYWRYSSKELCDAAVIVYNDEKPSRAIFVETVYGGYGTVGIDPRILEEGKEYTIAICPEPDDEFNDTLITFSLFSRPTPEVIAFDETKMDLMLKEKRNIRYISDCTIDSYIKWSSSDTSVATVSNGTVTAKKPGTCTITATLPGGNADQCTVNVYQNSDLKFTNTSEKLYGLSSKTLSLVNQSAIYDKITWKSSNTKIATVDSNGKVTAKEAGTVTITATVSTINKSATCKVTVIPKIKTKTVKVYLKKSYTNKLFAASGKVKWSSSNKKIATVSSKGKITGKKPGKCTITAKYKGKKYTCKVTVKHIKLSKKSAELARGKTLKLKVTGGSDKIKWKTSNRKVATVSSKGVVKAVDPGTCTISMTRNGYTKKCKVKVYRRKPDFDAEIMEYNTRNNYFVVWFENAGSKTLTITSGIKVEDDDYKKFDRSIRLNKKVKIKPGKSKYVRFYVKGSTTWWDYGDFTLYYKFTYDGKTYMAYARDDMDYSSYKKGTKWYDTYQEYRGEIDGE